MNPQITIIAALLSMMSLPASAFADHQYAAVGANQKQPFDVYTDGKNTYVEAIKGVLVRGALKDGDSFVVSGVPDRFVVQFNGKPLVIARTGMPIAPAASAISVAEPAPSSSPESVANARPTLSDEERSKMQEEVRAQVSAEVLAELQAQLQEARAASAKAAAQSDANTAADTKSEVTVTPVKVAPDNAPKSADQVRSIPAPQVAAAARAVIDPPAAQTVVPKTDVQPIEVVAASGIPAPANPVLTVISTIKKGSLIHEGLKQRAEADGWTFLWYPNISWEAIGDIDLTRYKNADEAVDDIVTGLREEGKPIQLRISDGNKIMEVLSTEVKND